MILHNAVVVTMDSDCRVFQNGAVFIDKDKIKAIGQSPDILQQFSHVAHHILDLHGQILLPGIPFFRISASFIRNQQGIDRFIWALSM